MVQSRGTSLVSPTSTGKKTITNFSLFKTPSRATLKALAGCMFDTADIYEKLMHLYASREGHYPEDHTSNRGNETYPTMWEICSSLNAIVEPRGQWQGKKTQD